MKFHILSLGFFLLQLVEVKAKIGNDDSDLNLGWPNFFNPKQAILGEVDPEKEQEKINIEIGSSNFPLIDFETLNLSEKEDELVENLIDYTIKGGLRGTYYVLNSTNSFQNLNKEAKDTIDNILTADAQLFEEVDKKLQMGEITEEGIKLKTPLFIKTTSTNLGKYGARITYHDGNETASLIHFGNWCGKGGRSAPVDNFDKCCSEQQKCYGQIIKQCPDVWNKPYQYMYAWALLQEEPVCVRSEYSCVNYVCDCDREASECFKHFVDHPWEVAAGYVPQPFQFSDYSDEVTAVGNDYEEDNLDEETVVDDEYEEDYFDEETVVDDDYEEDYLDEETVVDDDYEEDYLDEEDYENEE